MLYLAQQHEKVCVTVTNFGFDPNIGLRGPSQTRADDKMYVKQTTKWPLHVHGYKLTSPRDGLTQGQKDLQSGSVSVCVCACLRGIWLVGTAVREWRSSKWVRCYIWLVTSVEESPTKCSSRDRVTHNLYFSATRFLFHPPPSLHLSLYFSPCI